MLNEVLLEGRILGAPVDNKEFGQVELNVEVKHSNEQNDTSIFDVCAKKYLREAVLQHIKKNMEVRIVGKLYGFDGHAWIEADRIEIHKEDLYAAV